MHRRQTVSIAHGPKQHVACVREPVPGRRGCALSVVFVGRDEVTLVDQHSLFHRVIWTCIVCEEIMRKPKDLVPNGMLIFS